VIFRSRLVALAWLVIGVAIAANHHYFRHLTTWREILSAILAVLLWPLILLGISLHVHR
jgi:hypothetical protein